MSCRRSPAFPSSEAEGVTEARTGQGAVMIGLVVAVVVIALVVGAVLVAKRLPHPEQTATHGDEPPATTSGQLYDGADRPAGPDVDETVPPPGSQQSTFPSGDPEPPGAPV